MRPILVAFAMAGVAITGLLLSVLSLASNLLAAVPTRGGIPGY
jgi:hypothetical protein